MKEIHILNNASIMNDRVGACHDKSVESIKKSLLPIIRSKSPKRAIDDINVVDECTVELELFTIMTPMRPRANTDPFSQLCRSPLPALPEIRIEDCSTTVEKKLDDAKTNTAAGAFFVIASPPRRRSHTCPDDFFRRPRVRPPTPPPNMLKDKGSLRSSREKLITKHHKLRKVSEDVRIEGEEDANMTCSDRKPTREKLKADAGTGVMREILSKQKNKPVISIDNIMDTQKREPTVRKNKILDKISYGPSSLPNIYTEQREAS